MDLNKRIVKTDSGSPFHSNGFAQAANGNHFGAVSNMSFQQRRQIDRNRQAIQGYQRSAIGSTYGAMRAKPAPIARKIVTGRSLPHIPTAPPITPSRYNPLP